MPISSKDNFKKDQLKKKSSNAKLFIISGPSGSGKNAIVRGVLKKIPRATQMITCTTRQPRPGEKDGKDYYFLTEKKFKEKIKKNEFIEWARVHEIYYFGTSKKVLERLEKRCKIIILAIDVQGVGSFRKLKIPHTSIFINAESKEKLISRIRKRAGGMPDDLLKLRLKSAAKELKEAKKYDFQVINYEDGLDETINKVVKIITKKIPNNWHKFIFQLI